MTEAKLNFGIPNIDLERSSGGKVNPSSFAGHQLVVLFLPETLGSQAAELESYGECSDALCTTDAVLLVVASNAVDTTRPIALDPNGKAWRAFLEIAESANVERREGAAFYFTRGGAFHRVWPGRGHASEVVAELRSRL
jgi:peroxiredoxin